MPMNVVHGKSHLMNEVQHAPNFSFLRYACEMHRLLFCSLHLLLPPSLPLYLNILPLFLTPFTSPSYFPFPSVTFLSHVSSPSVRTSVRMASSTTCVAFPSLVVTAPPDPTRMMMWKAMLILSTGHWLLKTLIIR